MHPDMRKTLTLRHPRGGVEYPAERWREWRQAEGLSINHPKPLYRWNAPGFWWRRKDQGALTKDQS